MVQTGHNSLFGGIMRDCLLRLEKIQEARDFTSHEIDITSERQAHPQSSGIDELTKKLEEINTLIERRDCPHNESEWNDASNIKTAHIIRQKLLELEKAIDAAGKSEVRADGAFASLLRAKSPFLSKFESNQQEFFLNNLRKGLETAKVNFFAAGRDNKGSLGGLKVKRTKLSATIQKSPVKHTASRKVIGEMESSTGDNARSYVAHLESIKANEKQIHNNIEYLILEAKNLADYGRALGDEVQCQTEMLISSSEQASRSVSKISMLKKRLENILSEKSRQNIVLSTILLLVFLGLIGYLVYELVTFFA